jgi:hypothetical protein
MYGRNHRGGEEELQRILFSHTGSEARMRNLPAICPEAEQFPGYPQAVALSAHRVWERRQEDLLYMDGGEMRAHLKLCLIQQRFQRTSH